MLYLKTKYGMFWIIDSSSKKHVILGVNNQDLGRHDSVESAVHQLSNQTTGYLRWDSLSEIRTNTELNNWVDGDPEHWVAL